MSLSRKQAFVLLGVAGLLAYLSVRYRQNARFYYRLFQVQREASRFYATCATVTRNVAPHPAVRTRLDVYQPDGARDCPVFVYVYGGSWHSGNKALYAPMAQRLMPEGVVVVLPDYTTYPAARFPQPVLEIAAAIAWTLDNIHNFGGDPRRVIVGAQSAGAQVAGVALLDPRWLGAHGHSAAEVRGLLGISGVYDVPAQVEYARRRGRWGRYIERVMDGRANLTVASPISFVTSAAPPALLIHGDADTTVPINSSVGFHERLRSAGVPSEFVCYPGGGHSGILFDALTENPGRLVLDMLRFVRARTALPAQIT